MAEQLDLISENIIDDQEKSGSLLCDILQDHHPVTINIAFLDHAFHHGSLPRSFTAGLRAVVGVDGSGRSLRALILAAHEAALWRCSLRIVHVLPRWEFDIPLYPPGRWDEAEDRGRHIVAEAIAIARETYPDLDLTAALPSGAPASVFLAESEHAQVVRSVLAARVASETSWWDRSACRSLDMRRAHWLWSTTSPAATAARRRSRRVAALHGRLGVCLPGSIAAPRPAAGAARLGYAVPV
jgi:hypothetical protein